MEKIVTFLMGSVSGALIYIAVAIIIIIFLAVGKFLKSKSLKFKLFLIAFIGTYLWIALPRKDYLFFEEKELFISSLLVFILTLEQLYIGIRWFILKDLE